MPVWHERTKALRESGELVVLGVTQEQHPDRTRLFAQWHGIDWPILWDPFNLTGATAVPLYRAIDEHGIVRSTRLRDDDLTEFVAAAHEPPPGGAVERRAPAAGPPRVVQMDGLAKGEEWVYWNAVSDLLFGDSERMDEALGVMQRHTERKPEDAAGWFRLGVALRLRYDSDAGEAGDFQAALDAWRTALDLDPNQYIWRRRIQQYGPRLDKPYPFYGWIDEATAAIRARGEDPIVIRIPLTGSERAGRGEFAAEGGPAEPDPDARIRDDAVELVDVESAVAFDTSRQRPVARLHLRFLPMEGSDAHWNNEAEDMVVWLGASELPEGWELERRLVTLPGPAEATSREVRGLDVELRLPVGASGAQSLPGYALFNACRGESGQCLYVRRDFEVHFEVR